MVPLQTTLFDQKEDVTDTQKPIRRISTNTGSARLPMLFLAVLLTSLLFNGCGDPGRSLKPVSSSVTVSGVAHGGQEPISNSSIQIYAMSATTDGGASIPLLANPVQTDSAGRFSTTGMSTCPSASSQIYLVALGGKPSLASGANNPRTGVLALLGACGDLSNSTEVDVNEVTTVAAVSALSPFMKSYAEIGSTVENVTLLNDAINTANQLADFSSGTTPGPKLLPGQVAPTQAIATLADILATCVNTAGGTAGDGSPCGNLFSNAMGAQTTPTNTIDAMLHIAQNPTRNVLPLFLLCVPAGAPFQPTLQTAPQDWSLKIGSSVPTPTFSPSPGSYGASQLILLTDTNASAKIYYTTDGSTPSASSKLYTGAFTISASQTIRAIAIAGAASSSLAIGAYTIAPAPTAIKLAFASQPSAVVAGQVITPAIAVVVLDSSGNPVSSPSYPVTLAFQSNPGGGTLSGSLAAVSTASSVTFSNVSITQPGIGYSLVASSPGLTPAVSAAFNVTAPSLQFSVPSNTITIGSPVNGSVRLSRVATVPVSVSLVSSVTTAITVSPSVLTIPAGQATATFTLTAVAPGLSSLSATASGYTPAVSSMSSVTAAIPSTFFGMTVGDFSNLTPSMKFGTTRTWDSYPTLDWSDVNPSAGTYNFTSLDKFITINQARGAEIIYTFGRTPLWSSSLPTQKTPYGPGQCAPPTNIIDFDNYVRAIVNHAAGKIKYWELWNEPQDPQFYCGSVSTMVIMAQHASQIIRSIDPNAVILSPAPTSINGPNWFSSFLSGGGAATFDVVAFHGYWSSTAEDILKVVSNYRGLMATNGISERPLWDTESSWSTGSGTPSSDLQVGFIAKYYLLHWSLGISRLVWYAYDGGAIWGGLWTASTGASPAALSYGRTYDWMVGANLTSACASDQAGIWTCGLSRSGGYEAEAVWITNKTTSFAVPIKFTKYLDLSGVSHPVLSHTVTIGDAPILLETADLP
jgi:hypothetical protein